jgi:hypothetical protein
VSSHYLGASPIVLNKCTRKDILKAIGTSPKSERKIYMTTHSNVLCDVLRYFHDYM